MPQPVQPQPVKPVVNVAAARAAERLAQRVKQLELANYALATRCRALESDLERASDSFELDEAKSSLAELALVKDDAEAHRMRAASLQQLARQLAQQLDEQQRRRKLEAIGERADSVWQERRVIEQAAQSVAHMRSEVREARATAERCMAEKQAADRRIAALQAELDHARNHLHAATLLPVASSAAAAADPRADAVMAEFFKQHWFRGFTADCQEWRLADVPLDADDLTTQQQLIGRLRAALPPARFALQFVDLSRTSLQPADCALVAALVAACPPLSSLQLDGNAIGDAGCERLVAALAKTPDAVPVHLSVRGCALGFLACGALVSLAYKAPRLLSLNVSDNAVGPEGGLQLARAARRDGSHVKSVSARGCALRGTGALALVKAAVSLERLSFDLGEADDVDPVATRLALMSALADTLRVQAQHHGARRDTAPAAAGVLSYLTSWWAAPAPPTTAAVAAPSESVAALKSLSMSVAGLGGVGVAMLADALKGNESLTLLCVTHSNLTDRCAQVLFTALGHHRVLRELDVSHNAIGDFGAQFVADLLGNPALVSLCLDANRIGAAGATVIASAVLAHAKALATLRLADNPIGEGVAHLASVVQSASTVQHIDLRRCGAEQAWVELEKAVLQRDTKLKQITVLLN